MNFLELMGKKEPLMEELIPFLVDGPMGFPMLKHPYIYELVVDLDKAAFVNERFKHKKRAIEQAYKEKDYSSILALTERPYRLEEFAKFCDDIPDKEYWESLGWIWIDSENIWQHRSNWYYMFNNKNKNPENFRKFMMDENEQVIFTELPEKLIIYRGCCRNNYNGFSWTLDRKIAIKFAHRLKKETDSKYVLVGECNKEHVIAYFDGRNEKEIVIDTKHVTITKKEQRFLLP